MRVATALLLACLALLAACDDDDEQGLDVDAFCAQFRAPVDVATGLGGGEQLVQASAFFTRLQTVAPDPIASEVSTVADGLQRMVEGFAEFEGVEGQEAVQAVAQAADVNLDELAAAAQEVEQFATENCEDVETGE